MPSADVRLLNRTFQFGVDTQKFLFSLPQNSVFKGISSELSEASTYLGKVYEDAHKIESTSDFIWKIGIILSNIEICNYKLRILLKIIPNGNNVEELKRLIKETEELKNIFTSIKQTSEKKQKDESRPVIIPHVGKISFLVALLFYYIYSLTNIYFFILLFFISAIVFAGRISKLLFSWEWEDIKESKRKKAT